MKLDKSFGVGSRSGKLAIVSEAYRKKTAWGSRIYYLCKCDCGGEKIYLRNQLKLGKAISCGCLRGSRPTHGYSGKKHPLYSVWACMKSRCTRPKDAGYKNYGGRGIRVCEEWRSSFVAFKDWSLTSGYKEGLYIDRKNNDGNYEPKNCRWVDRTTQNRNNRRNVLIEAFGETKYLCDWLKDPRCKIKGDNLYYQRINKGFSRTDALFRGPDRKYFKNL